MTTEFILHDAVARYLNDAMSADELHDLASGLAESPNPAQFAADRKLASQIEFWVSEYVLGYSSREQLRQSLSRLRENAAATTPEAVHAL